MSLNIRLLNQLIADLNVGYLSNRKYININFNKHIFKVILFLRQRNYISSFSKNPLNNKIKIYLKYNNFNPIIFKLKNLVKPGKKTYIPVYKMLKLLNNHPDYMILTKKGILPLNEAYKLKIGGLLLFELKI